MSLTAPAPKYKPHQHQKRGRTRNRWLQSSECARGLTKTMPVRTDRNDARAIAQVMRLGWYSVVHVKSRVSPELRTLLTNRKTLLTNPIYLVNEVRGTLLVFGLKLAGRIGRGDFVGGALSSLLLTNFAWRRWFDSRLHGNKRKNNPAPGSPRAGQLGKSGRLHRACTPAK
jgi:hypothetical protein